MKTLTNVSRVLVGLLFMFSGFIKAIDPLGSAYKLEEYFTVFKMEWISSLSLPLSILLFAAEIILGFQLLIGSRMKSTSWLLLLIIVFFTFLTFYAAYFDVVKDCGCFGDFLHLSPWTSFGKDIALLILIVIIFIGKNHISPLFGPRLDNFFVILIILTSIVFPLYNYYYLPIIDFRPYAIGKNIPEQTKGVPDVLKYYYVLKNKKTGEKKEFAQWPLNWDKEWDYIENRTEVVKKGIEPKIHDFSIINLDGDDYTQDILDNPDYNFLLIAYDLDETDKKVQGKINDFVALCKNDSISFIGLTKSDKEQISDFRHEVQAMYEFYNTDGTVLKTMIRSNPGLILLKAGTVIDIWPYHSFPSYSDVKNKYFNKKG